MEVVRKLEEPPDAGRAGGTAFTFVVRAEAGAGQRKIGTVHTERDGARTSSTWSLACDEGAAMGGEDSAPTPLMYFAAGIAF